MNPADAYRKQIVRTPLNQVGFAWNAESWPCTCFTTESFSPLARACGPPKKFVASPCAGPGPAFALAILVPADRERPVRAEAEGDPAQQEGAQVPARCARAHSG